MRTATAVSKSTCLGLCLLWFIVVGAQDLAAQQTGRVTGRVTSEAGDPLIGATVTAVEVRRGALSDAQGAFELEVDPGTYTIRAIFIGYRSETTQVTVGPGQTVDLSFALTIDPLSLQGIVVTATRAERPLQEATLSMSVIPAERMEKFEPTSAADVLRLVPGVHAEGGGGEVAVNSFLRGLPAGGQFRYQTLQEDGMPLRSVPGGEFSAEDVFFRHDLNVRSLEVAKGGASTVFGISAPGGIINYRSKTGGDVLRSTVKVTVAQRDLYRVDLNSNGPLGENYRFNVGGFYRYDRGPRISDLPSQGLQLKGNVTRLLDRGYLRLYAKYIDDRAQFFLPFAHNSQTLEPAIDSDGTHNSAQAADFTVPTPGGRFESTMANGVLTKGAVAMFEYFSEFGDGWSVENKLRWSDLDHEFNIFIPFVAEFAEVFAEQFKPDPSYQEFYTFTDNGQPFTGDAVMEQGVWGRFRPTDDLADQITVKRRVIAGNTEHVFSLGAYLSRTELTDNQIRPTGLFELADRPRLVDLILVNPAGDDTVFVTAGNGISEASNNFFNRSAGSNLVAIYGGDEIIINDRLRIDIGGRYERQTATVRVENTDRFDVGDGESLAEQDQVFGDGTFVRRDVDFDDFGVALGVNYAVNEFLNVYGTGSRGFTFPNLGTFSGNVALDSEGNFVQPAIEDNEEFLQAEGGLRLAAPQLSGTLAGYWVQINDRQQTDIKIIDGQSVQIQDVVGESRTYGVEAVGAFAPRAAPGLTLESAFTYQDHEATDFVIGADDFSGNELKRQPNFILNSSLFYARYGVDFMFNWHHLGPRFSDDANLFELDAFDVFSADLGYTIPLAAGNSLRLGVNVYNLTDDEGLTEGDPRLAAGVDPTEFPFLNARPILPQRFRFSATYNF